MSVLQTVYCFWLVIRLDVQMKIQNTTQWNCYVKRSSSRDSPSPYFIVSLKCLVGSDSIRCAFSSPVSAPCCVGRASRAPLALLPPSRELTMTCKGGK